eukprot:15395_1
MCGICAIMESPLDEEALRVKLIECSRRVCHRGPDWSGYRTIRIEDRNISHGIGHERLAIVDPESGAQPMVTENDRIIASVNGEIYNYKELYSTMTEPYSPTTGSDCEVIIPLYMQRGMTGCMKALKGMFSFLLYDAEKDTFFVARDHIGITSLYMGRANDGSIWVASEMKALSEDCNFIENFPPGHWWNSKTKEFVRWYEPFWLTIKEHPVGDLNLLSLQLALKTSVVKRMMSDVPWGVLLSGGLDSSLVASIAQRHASKHPERCFNPKLHSFSVGLKGSPDLKAAKQVADFIGTHHHSIEYTLQEGLDAIPAVIQHLETYNATTIRAGVPMFLLARKIKAMGIKMVLSGEGADEILGGYLYFSAAPDAQEFFEETRDKLMELNQFDCLRANKSAQAWGLEARVPFLDADFLDIAMSIHPKYKMITKDRMEKYIIRKAFDCPDDPYLPDSILWRQKEQFSDGVGYGWIDALRDMAAERVPDYKFECASQIYPYNPPTTKEEFYYRELFQGYFEKPVAASTVPGGPSIACSTARAMKWNEEFKNADDCSGRAVKGVHVNAYGDGFSTLVEK